MCLDTVSFNGGKRTKSHEQHDGEIAFKIFKLNGKDFCRGSKRVKNKIYRSNYLTLHTGYRCYPRDYEKYLSGFHCFKTENDIRKYFRNISISYSYRDYIVKKVIVWNKLAEGKQKGADVAVYQFMMIL